MKAFKKRSEKRSPLKDHPLRNAGQSVDERIQKIIDEDASPYAALIGISITLALYEWWKWYFNKPPQPIVISLAALTVSAYVVMKIYSYKRKLRDLRLARDGERAVGQYLEGLRERGYRVFHDIIGNGFNIDHVLIGPAGVFTIETKTISKPPKGPTQISYDGEKVILDGFAPDRDPVIQAKAQANWLQAQIKESTGKNFKVRPVVLFPVGSSLDNQKEQRFGYLIPRVCQRFWIMKISLWGKRMFNWSHIICLVT